MGRHKGKTKRELKRHGTKRYPFAKILIVCEGEQTERLYFQDAKDHYRISTAKIKIVGDRQFDPMKIVSAAQRLYHEEKRSGDPFDKVYCVFDHDDHDSFSRARTELEKSSPRGDFVATYSIPCFEYWLLLHHTYTTKPFSTSPSNSACSQVIDQLKKYQMDYTKGKHGLFRALIDLLPTAMDNAKRALEHSKAVNSDNPSTRVHDLVQFLQKINKT